MFSLLVLVVLCPFVTSEAPDLPFKHTFKSQMFKVVQIYNNNTNCVWVAFMSYLRDLFPQVDDAEPVAKAREVLQLSTSFL